ncbi:uncharacterized protein [Rutidosis leptorrhynchoides]|uniref:uncharacterized protein n=1 Tax=Rutidosis leptorrhynchoides TaxID=125765 RepID=UPI003A9920F4
MEDLSTQINGRIDGVVTLQQYIANDNSRSRNGEGSSGRSNHQLARLSKIEFPKFEGEDVTGWLYRCRQFFTVDRIEEDDKVKIASIHMLGKALKDPLAELKNLRQTGTLQEYYDEFERLLNKVKISNKHAISLFLAGLQKEIELQVRIFKPRTLEDAFCLAKLQDDTLAVAKRRYTPLLSTPRTASASYNVTKSPASYINKNVASPAAHTQLVSPSSGYNTTQRFNSRRLTQKELDEKRSKGLCFVCDQKYMPGHKCSGQVYSLEVICEDESGDTQEGDEFSDAMDTYANDTPQISLSALTGTSTYQTMRITGHIRNQGVHILIDSGSTHNFLDSNMAKRIGCQLKDIDPMHVIVPGGHKIITTKSCSVEWKLSDALFVSNMVVIPLGGVIWKVELRGTRKPIVQWADVKKMIKSLSQNQAQLSSMFLYVYPVTLCQLSTSDQSEPKDLQQDDRLTSLLTAFEDVFATPTELPPPRAHDHMIPLKEGTQAINVRPYRHPPAQKNAIEEMVGELLGTGVIRPSQSPFYAPIVMVMKKDGS